VGIELVRYVDNYIYGEVFMVREILLLGNPKLYEVSLPVTQDMLPKLTEIVEDLHDTLLGFRSKYGVGRAIAAPQIGEQIRLIYMNIDEPIVFINPVLIFDETSMIEVLDDCMSFPNLLVRVKRYKKCTVQFLDLNWIPHTLVLEEDLSELIQHEYDHLDGILATMRAINNQSFILKT
jgi:peptide deformylase